MIKHLQNFFDWSKFEGLENNDEKCLSFSASMDKIIEMCHNGNEVEFECE